eukprot:6483357-Amphidinium_carterae.1
MRFVHGRKADETAECTQPKSTWKIGEMVSRRLPTKGLVGLPPDPRGSGLPPAGGGEKQTQQRWEEKILNEQLLREQIAAAKDNPEHLLLLLQGRPMHYQSRTRGPSYSRKQRRSQPKWIRRPN